MYVCTELFYGIGLASNTYAGNSAAKNNIPRAKNYTISGIIVTMGFSVLLCIFLFFKSDMIAAFYTSEANIKVIIDEMLTIYAMGNIADSTANITAIILRALNQEDTVFYCFLLAYYIVGIPLAFFLGISFKIGYKGIWYGLITGYWIMLVLMIIRMLTLNWEENIKKVYMVH